MSRVEVWIDDATLGGSTRAGILIKSARFSESALMQGVIDADRQPDSHCQVERRIIDR